ncbi:MAG: hypothetical protein HY053_03235 [Proteobacteria bacterium]|nr:hypothetical protein [Pseudomonadota bacterium]
MDVRNNRTDKDFARLTSLFCVTSNVMVFEGRSHWGEYLRYEAGRLGPWLKTRAFALGQKAYLVSRDSAQAAALRRVLDRAETNARFLLAKGWPPHRLAVAITSNATPVEVANALDVSNREGFSNLATVYRAKKQIMATL